MCDIGYYGNCRHKYCPKGPAWFHEPVADDIALDELIECSNMGICNHHTGQCTCRTGYEGIACERMSCATNDINSDYTCNNAGRCLSLSDIASLHKANGNSEPMSYGVGPYNPATWDASMIYSCLADDYGYYHNIVNDIIGYIPSKTGYNLNQYSCPVSYNPRLLNNGISNLKNETLYYNTQQFKCISDIGSFKLRFRGQETSIITYDNTIQQLEDHLNSLTTIGQVAVIILGGGSMTTPICDYFGLTEIGITFYTEIGTLPVIEIFDINYIDNVNITMSITQVEYHPTYECGGKGECDRQTGQCKCWKNYGTSDGFGNDGPFGDCGSNLIY